MITTIFRAIGARFMSAAGRSAARRRSSLHLMGACALTVSTIASSAQGQPVPDDTTVWYVDGTQSGSGGQSWNDAFETIEESLEEARASETDDWVWIADGNYTPSDETDPGEPRSATYLLDFVSVHLFGGFLGASGPGGGEAELHQRDPEANATILSGEFGEPDGCNGVADGDCIYAGGCNLSACCDLVCDADPFCCDIAWDATCANDYATNFIECYPLRVWHVVTVEQAIDSSVKISGFRIELGWADGPDQNIIPEPYGGGVLVKSLATPQVNRCVFHGNYSPRGGAVAIIEPPAAEDVEPPDLGDGGGGPPQPAPGVVLVNCSFIGNESDRSFAVNSDGDNLQAVGAGVWDGTGVAELHNCLFSGNFIYQHDAIDDTPPSQGGDDEFNGRGAGMFVLNDVELPDPRLFNCTFSENIAESGGGMYIAVNSAAVVRNGIFYFNKDGTDGSNDDERAQIERWAGALPGMILADHTDIQNLSDIMGIGNIDEDPLFCDRLGPDDLAGTLDDNLRISELLSPVVEAGLNAALPLDATDVDDDLASGEVLPWDLDKRRRIIDGPNLGVDDDGEIEIPKQDDGVVDMGAYEFLGPCASDFNDDGEVGPPDLAILIGNYGTCPSGVDCVYCNPYSTCPLDLNCDGTVGSADLAQLLGDWHAFCGDFPAEEIDPTAPTLQGALEAMGFADLDEYSAWLETVSIEEAIASAWELYDLLTS